MKKERRRLLSILLSLAMVLGLMPGMSLTAYADSVTLNEDQIIETTQEISGGVTVGNDITVTVSSGVVLTVNGGVNANDKTVTVKGPGTLIINGAKGSDGKTEGYNDLNGTAGGNGFVGNIIVDGATVTVTGGTGGKGGNDGTGGRTGGAGGNGVEGNVTVNSGSIEVTGGNGGTGGDGIDDGGSGGNGGIGVNGTVTVTGGSATLAGGIGGEAGSGQDGENGEKGEAVSGTISGLAEESDDNTNWAAVSGTTSDAQYVKVTVVYPLWVGGVQVTSDNANDVFGDGTVSYTPAEGTTPATLSLNGFTYSGTGDKVLSTTYYSNIIYTGEESLSLVITGTNSIENTRTTDNPVAIYSSKDVIISGTGSLSTVANDNEKGMGIYCKNSTLTIESGTVNTEAGYAGIYATNGVSITGGNVNATAKYGITGNETQYKLTIGKDVTSVIISGSGFTTDFPIINAIPGTGWTNTAGTEGETAIEVSNTEQKLSEDFKKIQFRLDPVSYLAWDETEKKLVEKTGDDACKDYTELTDQTALGTDGQETWYVLKESKTISGRINVSGTVNLILCDGATLTASSGITNTGATLNIYAQSTGDTKGALKANGKSDSAGIGGSGIGAPGGTVNIHGGNVIANGNEGSAGIGGGFNGNGGNVAIYGGTVITAGGNGGKGIGSGRGTDGSLTLGKGVYLYGGTSANPTTNIPETGGGYARYRYMVATDLPYLSYVDADGSEKLCTSYAVVTASTTAFEDGKWYVVSDTVEVTDRITVTGTAYLLLVDDKTLTAKGGIAVTEGNILNIYAQSTGDNMGALTATGAGKAGIGGCVNESCGTVTINGGDITANGGAYQPGIGGVNGGTVTVNGGNVTAIGSFAAGIGSGSDGSGGGTFTFNGGTVVANGGDEWSAGIGGYNSNMATGTITLGTGMYLYGGTTADPTTNIPEEGGDYARYQYMVVNNVFPHTHDFTYSALDAILTATCTVSGCTLSDNKVELSIVAPTLTTYGETGEGISANATLSGLDEFNDVTGQSLSANGIKYAGRNETTYAESTTVPVNAGDYTAKITLSNVKTSAGEGNSVTAGVDYSIAKADPKAEAPVGLSATYGQTLADVTLTNPEGNTDGTWAWADSTLSVGSVGKKTFKADFTPTDADNYNEVNNVDVTVKVNKAANPATVTSEATVIEGGNTIDLKDTVSMNGATGEVSYAFGGDEMGCTIDSSVLTSGTKTGTVSVNVTVAEDENYNALPATPVTVTITNKGIQTISANDVTVTYGDTDKSVSAEVTDPKTGAGKISYAVKEGSTDYIEVNGETGALNIKEVPADGKAYVTVTAAETMIYAKATKDVAITINRADPVEPTGLTAVYGQTLSEVALKEGWAWKDGTQSVGNVGTNTFKADYTPASPNYKAKSDVDLTVSVNRAPSTPATLSANNLTYDTHEQELVTVEREAEGGTMNYCLGNDADTAPTEGWAEAIPAAIDAGTYYVWYMVKGDANHYDSAPACISSVIDKADPSVTAPKAMALTYNGLAQELVSAGITEDGEMLYAPGTATEPTDAYKASIPTATEPGTYFVWYMVKGDGNHKDIEPSVVDAKIDPIDVKSIRLRAVTGTAMKPGTSQQLEVTTVPSGVPARHFTWTSSKPDTVSVNSIGLVTAGSVLGEAEITAKAHNGVQASITITVVNEEIEVKSVKIDETSVKKDPKPGDTFRLTAVIDPANATDKTVTWESSNTEVAEIGATGIVTVRKAGETTVTVWAKKGTVSDNIILKVENVPVKGITINTTGGDDYLVAGRTAKLTATVTPADATEKGVIWSSSDPDTASVNEYGVVTAYKEGRVTITAASKDNNEISATADFIVFSGDDSLYVEFAFGSDYAYTGSAITPMVNVYYRGELLTRDTDYTVSYKNNKDANDASNVKKAPTVKVTGKTVAATAEAVFKILPADIGDEDLVTAQEVTVASGKKAAPELYFGGTKLAGKDFTNPYAKDKFYNSRPITVYGKGNFTGEREIWINVKTEQEVKNQPKIKVKSFTPVKRYYNGQPQLLSDNEITIVSSTDKGKTKTPLIMDKDFYIAYPEDVTSVGTVKIAVVGMGDYTGVVKKSYKIEAAKDDDVAEKGIEVTFPYSEGTHTEGEVDYDTFTYRPGGVQPYVNVDVTLKSGEVETLISGRDYKVTYKDNKKAAKANKGKLSTATITFKGNYKSLKKVEKKFYITQADLVAASVYAGNKVVTKGNVKYPLQAPVVDIGGVTVKKSEYTVTYTDADDKPLDNKSKLNLQNSGESADVKVKITPKKANGNYTGENTAGSYVITLADASKDLSKAKVIIQKTGDPNHKAVRKFDFTGKPIVIGEEPNEVYELYVYIGKNANDPNKVVLTEGTDYTVEYSNNVKAGKATIILNAVDGSVNCFGSKTHTFNIVKGIMRWVK